MNINWYYFTDTNSSPKEIQGALDSNGISLISTKQLNNLHQYLSKNEETVLFLKTSTVFNVYDLSQEISILYPQVYIIIIAPNDMENLKKAMQVGASDILKSSHTIEEVQDVIQQAKNYMEHKAKKDTIYSINRKKEKCRVITVCNPKGGVGRTSLTVNLATTFERQGKRVVVIDGDVQFGDVSMFFNIKPKRTIYEWVKEAYDKPNYSIEKYLAIFSGNISILAAPPRPEFFEGINEEHFKAAIKELKELFDIVIIDTPAYISEIHLSCLGQSDELLLLTVNDLSVLRISKLYLEMLDTIKLKDRVKVIINKYGKNKGLEQKQIEEILETEIYYTLSDHENLVTSSISSGQPFTVTNSRNQLSKEIMQLTEKLSNKDIDNVEENKKQKRWFLIGK